MLVGGNEPPGMLIGLSGGIASGKSTVARLLAARGAVVIDADAISHAVLAAGGPAVRAVTERFGTGVLRRDGSVDRQALGALVFADPAALRDLEAITHPLVFAEAARLVASAPGGATVVVDAPLLVETGGRERMGLQALVVVAVEPEQQVERAVARGTSRERALAVIAAQVPPEQRLAAADYVLDNRGAVGDLELAVETLWADLQARFGAGAGAAAGVRP